MNDAKPAEPSSTAGALVLRRLGLLLGATGAANLLLPVAAAVSGWHEVCPSVEADDLAAGLIRALAPLPDVLGSVGSRRPTRGRAAEISSSS